MAAHAVPLPGSPASLLPGVAAPHAHAWVTGSQRPNAHFPCAPREPRSGLNDTGRALALGGPPTWQTQPHLTGVSTPGCSHSADPAGTRPWGRDQLPPPFTEKLPVLFSESPLNPSSARPLDAAVTPGAALPPGDCEEAPTWRRGGCSESSRRTKHSPGCPWAPWWKGRVAARTAVTGNERVGRNVAEMPPEACPPTPVTLSREAVFEPESFRHRSN